MKLSVKRICAISVSAFLSCSLIAPAAYAKEAATSVDKDETVYAYTTPTGSVRDITVKDLLANEEKASSLNDSSSLEGIAPTSNGTTINSQKGNALVWNAGGKEVQYKGSATEELPVGVRVAYTLNGRMVSPEEIANKSGHVTIRIEYSNKAKQTANIDGKQTDIYTPFVAMSTLSLDRDVFSNIEVTNGRVIDGSGTVTIIGYAMPGLQESLDLNKEDIEIPTYVLVEADATDFSIGSILTIVTPEVFANMDTSDLNTSEITDARNGLSDAMNGLVNGTNELADGMNQLAQGQQELSGGLGQLSELTSVLPSTTSSLTEGANGIRSGIDSAKIGAEQLAAGAAGVKDGIDQAKAIISSTPTNLDEQVQTLDALKKTGEDLTEEDISFNSALDTVIANISAQRDLISTAQTVLEASGEGSVAVNDGVQGLASGLAELSSGASQLYQGIAAFSGKMPQLSEGIASLKQGADQLVAATNAAAQGTSALASGVQTFNEDGIKALIDKLDESGIASMGSRLEALSNAADNYQTFSGLASGQTGSVKFIIKTDAIGE